MWSCSLTTTVLQFQRIWCLKLENPLRSWNPPSQRKRSLQRKCHMQVCRKPCHTLSKCPGHAHPSLIRAHLSHCLWHSPEVQQYVTEHVGKGEDSVTQLLSSQTLRVSSGNVQSSSLEADYDTSTPSVDFIMILLFLTVSVFFRYWKPFTSSCWRGRTFRLWYRALSVPATTLGQWFMDLSGCWWTNCWARSWLLKTTINNLHLLRGDDRQSTPSYQGGRK